MWTLVTGGAKHLGAALCIDLAKRGHSIALHYNTSEDEAKKTAAECRQYGVNAEVIQGDFSSVAGVDAFIRDYLKCFPETAHLINNVGNYAIGNFEKTSLDTWLDLFQCNLFAPIALIKALTPSLIKARGTITNIGVVGLNSIPATTYAPAYTATKLSLFMLTKSLAKELAGSGVRVNMVSPGYLETAVDLPADLSTLPEGRPGTAEEVANAVAFLINPENSYITGQNLEVAGGLRL